MPGPANRRLSLPLLFVATVAIFAGLQSSAGAWPTAIGGPGSDRVTFRNGAIIIGTGARPRSRRHRDSDKDGLSNRFERLRVRTNPRKADTDGDGLLDGVEIRTTKTNPRKADTDGDGFNDGEEVAAGSDPNNPLSIPPQPSPAPPPPPPPPPDTTAPDTQIASGPGSATQATTASFSFVSTEQGSTFECRLDAGSWSQCSSPKSYSGIQVGSHRFYVRASDASGNVDSTPAEYAWTVQTASAQAEATAIWTKPTSAVVNSPVVLDGTASTGTSSLTCSWTFENQDGSVVFDTRSGCKISFTFEAAGTKYVALDVHGSDGASDENRQSFMVSTSTGPDTTPPDTTLSSTPPSTTTSTGASFSFSSGESGSTFACQLDGSSWSSCSSPKSYSNLCSAATASGSGRLTGPATPTRRRRPGAGPSATSPTPRLPTRPSPPPRPRPPPRPARASPSPPARAARPSPASSTDRPGPPAARRSPTRTSRSAATASGSGRLTGPATPTRRRRPGAGPSNSSRNRRRAPVPAVPGRST